MAISLGVADPNMDPEEAYKRLCLCFPDLPESVEKAKEEYRSSSLLVPFINADYQRLNFGKLD